MSRTALPFSYFDACSPSPDTETEERKRKRVTKGIRGSRPVSHFERGVRQARAERRRTEEAAYRLTDTEAFAAKHSANLLLELCDQDKRLKRIKRREERRA
jgi:hypothetical protein